MAKYKVLQKFRDKETKEVYEVGQEIEMTVKRADKAIKNLKKRPGDFLERVEDKKVDPPNDNSSDPENVKKEDPPNSTEGENQEKVDKQEGDK